MSKRLNDIQVSSWSSTDPVNSSTYVLRYLSVLDQELTCISLSRLLMKLLSEKCSSTLRNVSSYQENIISMRQRSFAGNLASFSQWSICLTNGYFSSDIFTDRSISINKLNRSMWLAPAAQTRRHYQREARSDRI